MTTQRWQIQHGDCLELMRSLPDNSAAAVVTDPPYDEKTHSNVMSRMAGRKSMVSRTTIDFLPLDSFAWLDEAFRISSGWVIAFCSLEMLGQYSAYCGDKRWVRSGIWRKTDAAPQFSGDRPAQAAEGIAIMHKGEFRKTWNGSGSHAYWESSKQIQEGKEHPTQKPVALMRSLVAAFTPLNGLVLDPFCGSGSTGVACALEGFRFLGMEQDAGYCEIARRRIEAAYAQGKLDLFEGLDI